MDILEEIDETIKNKKSEWKYTPMREKSETDNLIDELLKEFSADNKPKVKIQENIPITEDYNYKTEIEERDEFEQTVYQPEAEVGTQPENNSVYNPNESDSIQVFSKKDIEKYDREYEEEAAANDSFIENNGSNNDNYEGYENGGFDDDYYDENDFNEDIDNIQTDDLDEEEYAEFEEFIDSKSEDGLRIIKPIKAQGKNLPKTIFRIFYTAVIAAFTIIGVLSSAIYCLEKFELTPSDIQEKNEALKEELCSVIYPFVTTSIDDFDDYQNISKEQLINLAIWEIIINSNGNVNVFKDEESDKIIIPHNQIEYAASKLFGEGKNIEPCDIKYAGLEIRYNKDKKGYEIPENYNIYTFYPIITNVKEQDGKYTVNVNCFNDSPKWTENKKVSPAKKMVFTLKKTSDYYNILSAKTVS